MTGKGFRMVSASSLREWAQVYRLYCAAFPLSERKPFSIIWRMRRTGRTDVWRFERDGRFVGFATTINGEGLVLIDYLALNPDCRGKGLGSRALDEMKRQYDGRGLFVEIESAYEPAGNQTERLMRKRFYEKNGMTQMNVMASVFGTPMELLGYRCRLDFEAYHAFYRDYYSPMAAEHIHFMEYPAAERR